MNNLKNKAWKCIVCGAEDFTIFRKGIRETDKIDVLRCSECGHLSLSYLMSPEELEHYYRFREHEKYLKNKFGICKEDSYEFHHKKFLSDNIARINSIRTTFKEEELIYDIGCGFGVLIKELERLGYNKYYGIEIVENPTKNEKIINADFSSYDIEKNSVDGFTMFQVLEHFTNPVKALRKVYRSLRVNGRCVIDVPNVDELLIDASNEFSNFVFQLQHISYFNKKTLKNVIEISGFNDVKIKGVQRYSVMNTFQWLIRGRPEDVGSICPKEYVWLDRLFRDNLEKNFKCDTLVAIAKK